MRLSVGTGHRGAVGHFPSFVSIHVRPITDDADDLHTAVTDAMHELCPNWAAASPVTKPGCKRPRARAGPAAAWEPLPADVNSSAPPGKACGWHLSLSPTLYLRQHEVQALKRYLETLASHSPCLWVQTLAARVLPSTASNTLFLAAEVEPSSQLEQIQSEVSEYLQCAGHSQRPASDVAHVSLAAHTPYDDDTAAISGTKRDRAGIVRHQLQTQLLEKLAAQLDEAAERLPWVGMCTFHATDIVFIAGKDVWRFPLSCT